MSSTRSTTERLASARPRIADSLDQLVGAGERADLLERILASEPIEPDRLRHRPASMPRRRVRAALVGAAAAAVVVTAFAARVWPGQSPRQAGPLASAVLVSHITAAARSVDDVVVITSTNDGVRSTFWTLTRGGHATRMRYSIDGTPSYDQTISDAHGRRTITNVDFAARAWWREISSPVPGDPCAVALGGGGATATAAQSSPPSCQVFGPTPREVVRSLDSGLFHITGHPVVDGRRAIKLTAHYPNTSGEYDLVVNARSYLPLLSVNSVNSPPFTTTYRYLRATPENLALLQVPIPSGFRHADKPVRCDPSQLGPHGSPDGCP